MFKPENYRDHFKCELWPIVTKLEQERKWTYNIILFGRVFNAISILIVLIGIFIFRGLKLPINQGYEQIVTWAFLIFIILVPLFVVIMSFIRYGYTGNELKSGIQKKRTFVFLSFVVAILLITFASIIQPVFIFFLKSNSNDLKYIPFIFFAIGINILPSKLLPLHETNFYKLSKSIIIAKIVSGHNPFYTYKPKSYIPSSIFFKSSLFYPAFITDYSGSDLIYGETGYGTFSFSQVALRLKTKYNKFGKLPILSTDAFLGIVYVTDFNKKFIGRTVIYPDFARRKFGSLIGETVNKISIFKKNDLVMLEDTEFEEEFAVYSDDQVEARFILTPTMIEKLKSLKKSFNKDLYFSFVDNKMYILIYSGNDLFKPGFSQSLLWFESYEQIYKTIGILIEFTSYLSPQTEAVG